MENNHVVYALMNKVTKQVYIGASQNVEARVNRHFYIASKDGHNRDWPLYANIRKYGRDNFDWIVLEELGNVSIKERNDAEERWCKPFFELCPDKSLNQTPSGSNKGMTHSEEHKRKVSENHGRSKQVIELNSGLIFKSKSEAAKHFGVSHHDIGWMCEFNTGNPSIRMYAVNRLSAKDLNFAYPSE